MAKTAAFFATLMIVIASMFCGSTNGSWLLATLPLSPFIFAIFYFIARQIDPPDPETEKPVPSRAEVKVASNRLGVHLLTILTIIIGLHNLLFSPAPAKNELSVFEGRVAALAWEKKPGSRSASETFRITVEQDTPNGRKRLKGRFMTGLLEPNELVGRLDRDRDALVGQYVAVGVYPTPGESSRKTKVIFTLPIGDETFRTYEQGLAAHRWYQLSGLGWVIAALLFWATAQAYYGLRHSQPIAFLPRPSRSKYSQSPKSAASGVSRAYDRLADLTPQNSA